MLLEERSFWSLILPGGRQVSPLFLARNYAEVRLSISKPSFRFLQYAKRSARQQWLGLFLGYVEWDRDSLCQVLLSGHI
jgi:hypothetical protein